METKIKLCGLNDVYTLQTLSIETFKETFEADNTETDLQNYLDKAYSLEKLKAEIQEKFSHFYFLYIGREVAGYIKVNTKSAQTEAMSDDSLEIERIYLRRSYQQHGLGKLLMNHVFQLAKENDMKAIWLGVWERNTKAISFYEKHGFAQTGQHSFFMGEDEQIDWIMTKELSY